MTKNFIVRHATFADLDGLLALENECFTSDKMSRQSFIHLLKKNPIPILIAEQNKKIIGSMIIFFRKNSKTARIYSLAVSKPYRQQQVAAALNEAAEKNILQQRCDTIILEVKIDNIAAISFYKKHHYETFGRYHHFYEDGTDALRMKKLI